MEEGTFWLKVWDRQNVASPSGRCWHRRSGSSGSIDWSLKSLVSEKHLQHKRRRRRRSGASFSSKQFSKIVGNNRDARWCIADVKTGSKGWRRSSNAAVCTNNKHFVSDDLLGRFSWYLLLKLTNKLGGRKTKNRAKCVCFCLVAPLCWSESLIEFRCTIHFYVWVRLWECASWRKEMVQR